MANISGTIKMALENAVLCRGAHGAKESYEYAEKMEVVIKESIKEKLSTALNAGGDLEKSIQDIINELER
jgi:hypothetical protein